MLGGSGFCRPALAVLVDLDQGCPQRGVKSGKVQTEQMFSGLFLKADARLL
jgi:hypothetical protein